MACCCVDFTECRDADFMEYETWTQRCTCWPSASRYAPLSVYARAMRCPVLNGIIGLRACCAMSSADRTHDIMGLRACYAISGTDIAFAAVGLRMLLWSFARAVRCPVLTWRAVLQSVLTWRVVLQSVLTWRAVLQSVLTWRAVLQSVPGDQRRGSNRALRVCTEPVLHQPGQLPICCAHLRVS
eukprot:1287950-Rhodomonas_salina.1